MSDLITVTKEAMRRSYNGISFSPEKRGEDDFSYYNEILKNDLSLLGERYGKDHYIKKFNDLLGNIVNSRGNLVSSMIAGPANFPFRSMEKKNGYYDNHVEKFLHFRERAINKSNAKRTLSPEAEIDEAINSIDRLEAQKDFAKSFNKIKNEDQRLELLIERYPDKDYNSLNDVKYSFNITSMTTKIRERKKKIEVMKNRIKNKDWTRTFDGGSMYVENNRVIIKHDEKPSKEVISQIKAHGFKYSSKFTCWCCKHTSNARYKAELLLEAWSE